MSIVGRWPTVIGYWGTRVQSSQEVAQTMRAFLDDLETIDPGVGVAVGVHQKNWTKAPRISVWTGW